MRKNIHRVSNESPFETFPSLTKLVMHTCLVTKLAFEHESTHRCVEEMHMIVRPASLSILSKSGGRRYTNFAQSGCRYLRHGRDTHSNISSVTSNLQS